MAVPLLGWWLLVVEWCFFLLFLECLETDEEWWKEGEPVAWLREWEVVVIAAMSVLELEDLGAAETKVEAARTAMRE